MRKVVHRLKRTDQLINVSRAPKAGQPAGPEQTTAAVPHWLDMRKAEWLDYCTFERVLSAFMSVGIALTCSRRS